MPAPMAVRLLWLFLSLCILPGAARDTRAAGRQIRGIDKPLATVFRDLQPLIGCPKFIDGRSECETRELDYMIVEIQGERGRPYRITASFFLGEHRQIREGSLPRSLDAETKAVTALTRYFLPEWDTGPAWMRRSIDAAARRYCSYSTIQGNISVAITRWHTVDRPYTFLDVTITRQNDLTDLGLDNPACVFRD